MRLIFAMRCKTEIILLAVLIVAGITVGIFFTARSGMAASTFEHRQQFVTALRLTPDETETAAVVFLPWRASRAWRDYCRNSENEKLLRYGGCAVKRFSLPASSETGAVTVRLYVYKQRIIGGDITDECGNCFTLNYFLQ